MRYTIFKSILLLGVLPLISCGQNTKREVVESKTELSQVKGANSIVVGANQIDEYMPILKGRKIGIVANQTSVIFKGDEKKQHVHLVDSLLSLDVDIVKVFAPEHGFRGTADAGEHVTDGIDKETGLPIISLYGVNRKPSAEHLNDIDVMIFDIQDVGVRFYTYIGTLHYIMEACAEANIPLLILDRPNPNGHYIDGPILEPEYKSFVGMHPVPVVHALTIGEYAQMINGERWLDNLLQCAIKVIPVKNYTHQTTYSLPIKPSPNLPNDASINLYASLCLFEGTGVSIGRGTEKQFQIVGVPDNDLERFDYTFTPQPNFGAKHPKNEGKVCYGYDLSEIEPLSEFNLKWFIDFYNAHKESGSKEPFYNRFFLKLAGTKKIQQQIEQGLTAKEIKATWQEGIDNYKITRSKYLIYK